MVTIIDPPKRFHKQTYSPRDNYNIVKRQKLSRGYKFLILTQNIKNIKMHSQPNLHKDVPLPGQQFFQTAFLLCFIIKVMRCCFIILCFCRQSIEILQQQHQEELQQVQQSLKQELENVTNTQSHSRSVEVLICSVVSTNVLVNLNKT